MEQHLKILENQRAREKHEKIDPSKSKESNNKIKVLDNANIGTNNVKLNYNSVGVLIFAGFIITGLSIGVYSCYKRTKRTRNGSSLF